jgi:hypothetical protein
VQVQDKRLLLVQTMNRTWGTWQQQSTSSMKQQIFCRFTYNQCGHQDRNSQPITRFKNYYIRSYLVTELQILAHPMMQFSATLPRDILRHILDHMQLQQRQEQQAIIRRNQNCNYIRFPYGLRPGFCG